MRFLVFFVSFLMAFLLFAVQPMATKLVLPTLGGTPAVWNTAMFTFQLLLLGGYVYVHMLARHVPARLQLWLHAALVLASALLLPLAITLPATQELVTRPIYYLVMAFLTQVGLPFFCLAATAPLLQSWVSRSRHPLSNTPYVLYSASNLGSFAGLLGYVGVVEPLLDLGTQRLGWSGLYAAGMVLLLATAATLRSGTSAQAHAHAASAVQAPRWGERLTWVWLAFLPSSLSLGLTTYITTDVASMPLLWVIPLSIYLLSFVDAFRTRPLLVPACARIAHIVGLAALILYGIGGHSMVIFISETFAFAVLAFAMHGWLARRQPAPSHLTQFYVCLSVGGALGGVMNGLLAPQVLHDAIEFPAVVLLASITAFLLLERRNEPAVPLRTHLRSLGTTTASVLLLTAGIYGVRLMLDPTIARDALNSIVLMHSASLAGLVSLVLYRRYARAVYACVCIGLIMIVARSNGMVGYETLFKDRNFFGVARVYESKKDNARYFMYDTTVHGMQSLDPARALNIVSYYSPLIEIFEALPVTHRRPMAVVGQGIGTLKCYARKGQQVDFFEINPMVEKLAEDASLFTYMRDCPGAHEVLLGDGRIRLQEQPDARYGVIVLDAFSSDAIPGHLLTTEALALYVKKLAPGGVLMFNVSNRHIDLRPLLGAQAEALGLVGYSQHFKPAEGNTLMLGSIWVMIARSDADIAAVRRGNQAWQKLESGGRRPWTDQYINLLPYFKR